MFREWSLRSITISVSVVLTLTGVALTAPSASAASLAPLVVTGSGTNTVTLSWTGLAGEHSYQVLICTSDPGAGGCSMTTSPDGTVTYTSSVQNPTTMTLSPGDSVIERATGATVTLPAGTVWLGVWDTIDTQADTVQATIGASYAVTYNGNTNTGGAAPVDGSSPYAASATVTVLDKGSLTNAPLTFTGWNTQPDGTGTPYLPAATFTITKDTTLFAQWADRPGAPTAVLAKAGNGNATIDFTAPTSDGGAAITTYTATSDPGGKTGTCSGPTACTITVGNLTNGVAYQFTVTATNAAGTSVDSAKSTPVTPAAPAPSPQPSPTSDTPSPTTSPSPSPTRTPAPTPSVIPPQPVGTGTGGTGAGGTDSKPLAGFVATVGGTPLAPPQTKTLQTSIQVTVPDRYSMTISSVHSTPGVRESDSSFTASSTGSPASSPTLPGGARDTRVPTTTQKTLVLYSGRQPARNRSLATARQPRASTTAITPRIGLRIEGFRPNSTVAVYLLPDVLLGTLTSDGRGLTSGNLAVPADLPTGDRVLQVNGFTPADEVLSLSLGVVVRSVQGKIGAVTWALTPDGPRAKDGRPASLTGQLPGFVILAQRRTDVTPAMVRAAAAAARKFTGSYLGIELDRTTTRPSLVANYLY